jgi:hypothetical protein
MEKLTLRAEKAGKAASEAKIEAHKARDSLIILNRDFKTMKSEVEKLKARK